MDWPESVQVSSRGLQNLAAPADGVPDAMPRSASLVRSERCADAEETGDSDSVLAQGMGRRTPYVFGIGLPRTGSHSLVAALHQLGVWTAHFPHPTLMLRADYVRAFCGCDGAVDSSVAACFRELDAAFPHSKFILTTRHRKLDWAASVQKHFGDCRRRRLPEQTMHQRDFLGGSPSRSEIDRAEVRRRLFGTDSPDTLTLEELLEAEARHTTNVVAHFTSDGEHRLLVLPIDSGSTSVESETPKNLRIPVSYQRHLHF
eukprot:SAG31_NODE_5172_length_2700_cov_4.400231_3_plen_259_part_00